MPGQGQETKTVVTGDGAIAELVATETKFVLQIRDEGTAILLALVDVKTGESWEQAMEVDDVDKLIAALKRSRATVMARKYGRAKGARRGNR